MRRIIHVLAKLKDFVEENLNRVLSKFNFSTGVRRHPLKIVIGASNLYQKGWLASEQEYLDLVKEKDWKKYFKKNSIDALLAEHVWEHLTIEDAKKAAVVCFKYLKNGGYIRAAVPDGLFPDSEYVKGVKPGGIGPGAGDHKMLYTYKSFRKIFEKAGFDVLLLEYFDERGAFHHNHWDKNDGVVLRSRRYDERNTREKIGYTSIILDAIKK